jgi:hypothetical protein
MGATHVRCELLDYRRPGIALVMTLNAPWALRQVALLGADSRRQHLYRGFRNLRGKRLERSIGFGHDRRISGSSIGSVMRTFPTTRVERQVTG